VFVTAWRSVAAHFCRFPTAKPVFEQLAGVISLPTSPRWSDTLEQYSVWRPNMRTFILALGMSGIAMLGMAQTVQTKFEVAPSKKLYFPVTPPLLAAYTPWATFRILATPSQCQK
jgi:hypothetical protein